MSNYSIKYKSGSLLYDMSGYVTEISDVPYFVRNPDSTLVADGYSMKMTSAFPNITFIDENTEVYFYSSSLLIHNGRVSEKIYDYDKREYKLKVRNALLLLDDKLNRTSVCEEYFNNFTQSVDVNGHQNILIKHNDLITAYFSASGFQLDWTTYYATQSLSVQTTTGYNATAVWGTDKDVTALDLWYLPGAIYCINQPKVWSPQWLNYPNGVSGSYTPNTGADDNMLSTWEVVNILSTMFGYNYIAKDTGSFYVMSRHFDVFIPTVDEDVMYSYEEKKYKKYNAAKCTFASLTLWTGTGFSGPLATANRWFPTISAMNYYTQNISTFNGLETDAGSQPVVYNNSYSYGAKPTTLKWYNHLVPIMVEGTTPRLIYPETVEINTIIKFQRDAAISSGIEKKVVVASSNLWQQPAFYHIQSAVFKNPKQDTVEIIWREII